MPPGAPLTLRSQVEMQPGLCNRRRAATGLLLLLLGKASIGQLLRLLCGTLVLRVAASDLLRLLGAGLLQLKLAPLAC